MSNQDKTQLQDAIRAAIQSSALGGRDLKDVLRAVVGENWPDLPPWSRLTNGPLVEEVQKATAGSGVVVTFVDPEENKRKVVLAEAGMHYFQKPGTPFVQSYMIPGGFIVLDFTEGSTQVPASQAPEDGRTGAAREVEEEFVIAPNTPLLSINPDRLKPMDTLTLAFPHGEKRIVLGMMLELNADEVAVVKAHVEKLASDPAYKTVVAGASANEDSGLPEVGDVRIFNLDDVAAGQVNLHHKDQQSLFKKVKAHFDEIQVTVDAAVVLALKSHTPPYLQPSYLRP